MPEEGIAYEPKSHLLSYEEITRLLKVLGNLGFSKVRFTGGEPFLRKGMMEFLERLMNIDGITTLNITTNGTLTKNLIPDLKAIGINSINLSLDTLDEQRFFDITRRNSFKDVMETLDQLIAHNIKTKINAVVMAGRNTEDIIPLIELAKNAPIDVRFIEEMPFNGTGEHEYNEPWTFPTILNHIESHYPNLQKLTYEATSTSFNYQIPNYQGTVGIIAAYSRLFCGSSLSLSS